MTVRPVRMEYVRTHTQFAEFTLSFALLLSLILLLLGLTQLVPLFLHAYFAWFSLLSLIMFSLVMLTQFVLATHSLFVLSLALLSLILLSLTYSLSSI